MRCKSARHGRRGGKPGRGGKFQPIKDTLDARKKKSQCKVCYEWGHWSGDPECPGPPQEVSAVTNETQLDDDEIEIETASADRESRSTVRDRERPAPPRISESCERVSVCLRWCRV